MSPLARSLVLCLLPVAFVLSGCRSVAEPAPRNVVILLLDTLRADHTSLYGYARDTTPRLAALAQRGIVFERARSQASCTFPSVNSLLTSRHPAQFFYQPYQHFGIPAGIPSIAEVLQARGYATIAVSASGIVRATPSKVNRLGGFERGFDTFDETCLDQPASCVNRQGLAAIDAAKRPFLAYLHYLDPHAPYAPPREHVRRFAKPYRGNGWIVAGKSTGIERQVFKQQRPDLVNRADVAHLVDLYDDEIAYLDGQLQALFDGLEKRGLLDDTMIVLTADHGEEFLDHGSFGHCRTLYDTETHIPMVIWVPRGPAGRRAAPVQNLDVVPTILDYLGIEQAELEGRSLRGLVDDGDDRATGRLVHSVQNALRSIDDGRVKLIFDTRSGRREVFDLASDQGEQKNLADAPPSQADALQIALGEWIGANEKSLADARGLDYGERIEDSLRSLGYLE